MADHLPTVGFDEIAVSIATGRRLCNDRAHARLGCLADVIVTFGELGTRWRDALWPECWGRSYAMCGECWNSTRRIAGQHRPGLVIIEANLKSTKIEGSVSGA